MAVSDKGLVPVQHPAIAFADGGRPRASGIGTGTGLGQSPGAEPFAGSQPGNVLALLLFVAGDKYVVGAE